MTRTPSGVVRLNITSGWRAKIMPPRNIQSNFIHEQRHFFKRLARRVRKRQKKYNYGLIFSHYVIRQFLNRLVNVKLFFYDGAWIERRINFGKIRRKKLTPFSKKKGNKKVATRKLSSKEKYIYARIRYLEKIAEENKKVRRRYFRSVMFDPIYFGRWRKRNNRRRKNRYSRYRMLNREWRESLSVSYSKYTPALRPFFLLNGRLSFVSKINKRRRWLPPAHYKRFLKRKERNKSRVRFRFHQTRIKIWHFRFTQMARGYLGTGVRLSFQFFGPGKMTAYSVSRYIIGSLTNRFRIDSINYRFVNGLKRFRFCRGSMVQASGRFDRRQMASFTISRYGKIGTSLFRSKTRFSFSYVRMKFGVCGIKVWLPDRVRRFKSFRRSRKRFHIKILKLKKKGRFWCSVLDWREYQNVYSSVLTESKIWTAGYQTWLPYNFYRHLNKKVVRPVRKKYGNY